MKSLAKYSCYDRIKTDKDSHIKAKEKTIMRTTGTFFGVQKNGKNIIYSIVFNGVLREFEIVL